MARQTQYYPFIGGLNTETPALSLPPGELIDVLNYEPLTSGGYRRIDGIERYSGKISPSGTAYYTIPFTLGANEPPTNGFIIGGVSGATARIVDVVVESGDWSTSDAAGYLVVIIRSGAFDAEEPIYYRTLDAFSSGFSFGYR